MKQATSTNPSPSSTAGEGRAVGLGQMLWRQAGCWQHGLTVLLLLLLLLFQGVGPVCRP